MKIYYRFYLITQKIFLYGKGVALHRLGKSEEAITWLGNVLIIHPDSLDALLGKGVALYNLGKYEEAISWFDKALEIDPT